MTSLSEDIITAWENREGPAILATVDPDGIPNAVYATCVSMYDDETLVVADNFLHKTRANIHMGSDASLLFITKDRKSYQIKGDVEYHTSGAIFEDMKNWNPTRLPGHAAVAIKVKEAYSGAEQLV